MQGNPPFPTSLTKTSQPSPNVLIQQSPLIPQQQQMMQSQMGYQNQQNPQFVRSSAPLSYSGYQPQQFQHMGGMQGSQEAIMRMKMQQNALQQNAHHHPALQQQMSGVGGQDPAQSVKTEQQDVAAPARPGTAGSTGSGGSTSQAGSRIAGSALIPLAKMENLDELSPIALSRLGKELTQEAVNRLGELFQKCREVELPTAAHLAANPAQPQRYKQTQLQIAELLRIMTQYMAKISDIYARLNQAQQSEFPEIDLEDSETVRKLLVQGNQLNEPELTTGASTGKLTGDLKALVQTRTELQNKLKDKRSELAEVANFLRNLEWQIGALLGICD